jgi:hypothetical protein
MVSKHAPDVEPGSTGDSGGANSYAPPDPVRRMTYRGEPARAITVADWALDTAISLATSRSADPRPTPRPFSSTAIQICGRK